MISQSYARIMRESLSQYPEFFTQKTLNQPLCDEILPLAFMLSHWHSCKKGVVFQSAASGIQDGNIDLQLRKNSLQKKSPLNVINQVSAGSTCITQCWQLVLRLIFSLTSSAMRSASSIGVFLATSM